MKAKTKFAILKVAIPLCFVLTVLVVMHLVIPGASHQRRLFDLGSGYTSFQDGNIRIYYHKDGVPTEDAKVITREFKQFVHGMVELWSENLKIAIPNETIDILLHSSNADYDRYWNESKRRTRSAGKYDPNNHTISIRANTSVRAMLRTLRHEMTHMLLDLNGLSGGANAPMAIWVNEGLAQYFENGYRGGGIENYHNESPPVPLSELVLLDHKSFMTKKTVHHNYKESVLLVTFFMEAYDGKYQAKFLEFVRRDSRRRMTLSELAGNYFNLEEHQLLKQWVTFLSTRDRALTQKRPKRRS